MWQLSSLSHASVSLSWTPYGLTKKTRCPLVEDAKSVACQSQRQSRPQVETNMNLLHCQMFHSQSKGNCFVKLTYLFVKTIKISLSEQRFKKLDSLHINLKPFHKTPCPIFTFHAPSFEIHVTDCDIPSINEIKKPFPCRYHSPAFYTFISEREEYFPHFVAGQQICLNCCNLLGHIVTDVFKYQWEKIEKMLLGFVKDSYFCGVEILQKID